MNKGVLVKLNSKELFFCPYCGSEVVSCEACDLMLCSHQEVVCVVGEDAEPHHYHKGCVKGLELEVCRE